jgi:hypothetical protein
MTRIALLVAACALALAACGPDEAVSSPDAGADPAAGACPVDEPDCVDTPELTEGEPVEIGEEGIEQLREDARFYLGVAEEELPEIDTVRIGRRGEEHMMLTEDYRVGRMTVGLDDVEDDGTFVVTEVTVELPDGPETFTLET